MSPGFIDQSPVPVPLAFSFFSNILALYLTCNRHQFLCSNNIVVMLTLFEDELEQLQTFDGGAATLLMTAGWYKIGLFKHFISSFLACAFHQWQYHALA